MNVSFSCLDADFHFDILLVRYIIRNDEREYLDELMREVASKRLNIVDCELVSTEGGSETLQPKSIKELIKINQASIIKFLNEWTFNDPKSTRNKLIEDLSSYLSSKGLEAECGCIPSIIVEKYYPIEASSYSEERYFSEFLGRMLWIRDQWESVIGIFSGVTDPKLAEEIENAYLSVFLNDEGVTLLLV